VSSLLRSFIEPAEQSANAVQLTNADGNHQHRSTKESLKGVAAIKNLSNRDTPTPSGDEKVVNQTTHGSVQQGRAQMSKSTCDGGTSVDGTVQFQDMKGSVKQRRVETIVSMSEITANTKLCDSLDGSLNSPKRRRVEVTSQVIDLLKERQVNRYEICALKTQVANNLVETEKMTRAVHNNTETEKQKMKNLEREHAAEMKKLKLEMNKSTRMSLKTILVE